MKHRKKPLCGAVDETEDVASATECTGLIPALPRDDAEADEAASLYAVHGAKKSGRHED